MSRQHSETAGHLFTSADRNPTRQKGEPGTPQRDPGGIGNLFSQIQLGLGIAVPPCLFHRQ